MMFLKKLKNQNPCVIGSYAVPYPRKYTVDGPCKVEGLGSSRL